MQTPSAVAAASMSSVWQSEVVIAMFIVEFSTRRQHTTHDDLFGVSAVQAQNRIATTKQLRVGRNRLQGDELSVAKRPALSSKFLPILRCEDLV